MRAFRKSTSRCGAAVILGTTIGLATTALGAGSDLPDGSVVVTQAQILAGFLDTGDTCDNTDADDVGPLTMPPTDCGASTAPDEWYRLVITSEISIDIDLCAPAATDYDSKIFVLDATTTALQCNDETGCTTPGTGPSAIRNLTLTPGTYDVAIDGSGSACGAFAVEIREFVPNMCFLEFCSPAPLEGEPCDETGPDNFNGGCNSTPEAFSVAAMNLTVRGTNWANNGRRDTDWWSFSNSILKAYELRVRAEADTVVFLAQMQAGGGCPVAGIPDGVPAFSGDCDSTNVVGTNYILDAGDYIMFVGCGLASGGGIFDGFPCTDGATTNNEYEVFIGDIGLPPPPCPWNLGASHCDRSVDFADLLVLIANWGPCPTSDDVVPEDAPTMDVDLSAIAPAHSAAAAAAVGSADMPPGDVQIPPGTNHLAIDGFGTDSGIHEGEVRLFTPNMCFLDPPCTGPLEGEPCDTVNPDNFNGGCNSTPEAFSMALIDQKVCGTNWADNGTRDTDWWAFNNTVLKAYQLEVRAEVDTVVFLAQMTAGGTCPVISIPNGTYAFSGDCDTNNIVGDDYVLDPGDYIMFVGAGIASGGGIFDGFPCPDGSTTNNAYEVEIGNLPLPPPPCPWDFDEDDVVDFADLLQLIANWGPCPGF